jgi:lipoprotein-anchoring transpeptidase ErfK/SrfK
LSCNLYILNDLAFGFRPALLPGRNTGEINMRRLVGISGKRQKALLAMMALIISLTSIHMAAAARTASLRRQQDKLEQLTAGAQPVSALSLFPNSTPMADQAQQASGAQRQAPRAASGQNEKSNAAETGSAASARTRQIVISIADRKLALMEDGQVLKVYPIAVGASGMAYFLPVLRSWSWRLPGTPSLQQCPKETYAGSRPRHLRQST